MARFHATAKGNVPFTAEEEAEWDATDARKIVVEAEEARLSYQRQRAEEYPPIGDQLDALFHAGVFPADMAATLQAIKNKYPKP
jgi:hypothetical protein